MLTKQPSSYYILTIAIFSVFIILVLLNFSNHRQNNISLYFSSALKEAEINESVTLHGETYQVYNGEITNKNQTLTNKEQGLILRLAYSKTIAKRDPLFALPGTDIEAFEAALIKLKETQADLASFQDDYLDKIIVKYALYPTSYLNQLIKTERARRDFINEGNYETYKAYRKSLIKISSIYKRESLIHNLSFRFVIPKDTSAYVTEQQRVTRDNSLNTFTKLRAVVDAAGEIISQEESCLRGEVSKCSVESLSLPNLEFDTDKITQDPIQMASVTNTLNYYQQLIEKNPAAGKPYGYKDNPFIYLEKSHCQNPEVLPLFSLRQHPPSKGILELGDIRLLKSSNYKDVLFFDYFNNLDLEYLQMSTLPHYVCPELHKEIGAVYSTYNVQRLSIESPLSMLVNEDEHALKLQETEELLSSTTVKETNACEYINLGLKMIEARALTTDVSDKLIDLSLQLQNKSSSMERLLSSIPETESGNILLATQGGAPLNLDIKHLFYTRSAFVQLSSLGIIPSVNPVELFESFSLPKEDTPYVYLSDLISIGVPLTIITDDVSKYLYSHYNESN